MHKTISYFGLANGGNALKNKNSQWGHQRSDFLITFITLIFKIFSKYFGAVWVLAVPEFS